MNNLEPDFNLLNKIGDNIIKSDQQVEETKKKLFEINANNVKALELYGNYLKFIRNNEVKSQGYLSQVEVYKKEN